MATSDKYKTLKRFGKSFVYAIEGITTCLRNEFNIKFQFFMGLLVITLGLFFQLNRYEWAIIILCMAAVITAELMNSAIEKTIDLIVGQQIHPLAKFVKDAAAGAVLVMSLGTALVGLVIFLPYIQNFVTRYL